MKILAIRGKNLASLAGEFDVDFQQEPLASAGLFAISGVTGAGKSTLLDALCLALYDDTPRLLKAGARGITLPDVREARITPRDTRNILRRGSADGHAEVDFVGSDGNAYRARWSVRRSRGKADGTLQKINMTLQQLPDLRPIGGTNNEVKAEIVQRIGLSFDQFTRAVLLAQNEFSAFLKADDNERGELLETLTGSSIYTVISKRAYERAKQEQSVLQQLNGRLADHKPLPPETRAQLEQDSLAAVERLRALEQRKKLLEDRLRWHQERRTLQQQQQEAVRQWNHCLESQQQAAERRAILRRIEAVQSASPILLETDRLEREITATRTTVLDNETGLAKASADRETAESACRNAATALQAAEFALADAASQLNQARALDVRIDTQRPVCQQAQQHSKNAESELAKARRSLQDKEAERIATLREKQNTETWLTGNSHLKPLAEKWPRWDTLFSQAAEAVQAHAGYERAAATANQAALDAQQELKAATSRLAQAEAEGKSTEAALVRAVARLTRFDPQALAQRRQSTEAHRDLLTAAEKAWTALAGSRARQQQQCEQASQLQQALEQAERAQQAALRTSPGLEAVLAQAERSLKRAEAACGETVESLRDALQEDEACPVCGSREHPYRLENPPLHAALTGLQSEVEYCRRQVQDNVRQLALHTATMASRREQLDAVREDLVALANTVRIQTKAWEIHALKTQELIVAENADAEAGGIATVAADERADWFVRQQEQLQIRLQNIAEEEQAYRLAAEARDTAQAECDKARSAHISIQEACAAASAAHRQATVECSTLQDKRNEAAQRLDTFLTDLSPALVDAAGLDSPVASGWRDRWRLDPLAFHAHRRTDAEQWLARTRTLEQHDARIVGIATEHAALSESLDRTQAVAIQAAEVLRENDRHLEILQAERQALFGGRPVEQVEAGLQQAIETAKAELQKNTEAFETSAAEHTRLMESLKQARTRLQAQTQDADEASGKLATWLQEFNDRHAQVLDNDGLRALLAHPPEWIAGERSALHAIDSATERAEAILKERRHQCERHEERRPPAEPMKSADRNTGQAAEADAGINAVADHANESIDTLQTDLGALARERDRAGEQVASHQLSIAQDNQHRQRSADTLAQIEQQEAVYRRWAQLDELIGSADGKKFRNYAQQFTLDVLLGYANRHLHDLSRRYRLERIPESLALMVLDHDMGSEMRSVHSLSGGESFLVSLALALGLASLSSNRVKVESLFIDEGFGSLDADTLRVAMDALDGLQSMGRKVGVISHVQEMAERIGTRILVERAAGGRSRLAVTHS